MFVQAQRPLPLAVDVARSALDRALADGGLVRASHRAYHDGLACLPQVGPAPANVTGRRVRVTLLGSRPVGSTIVVPLRWEAAGPAGRPFPALDANLSLAAAAGASSVLSVIGRYAPPVQRLESALDDAAVSRAAHCTATTLLAAIAALLCTTEPGGRDRPGGR